MTIEEHNTQWKQCFDSFRAMTNDTRRLFRRLASISLTLGGAEEVGSSDINHELFRLWRMNGKDWIQILANEAEALLAYEQLNN